MPALSTYRKRGSSRGGSDAQKGWARASGSPTSRSPKAEERPDLKLIEKSTAILSKHTSELQKLKGSVDLVKEIKNPHHKHIGSSGAARAGGLGLRQGAGALGGRGQVPQLPRNPPCFHTRQRGNGRPRRRKLHRLARC